MQQFTDDAWFRLGKTEKKRFTSISISKFIPEYIVPAECLLATVYHLYHALNSRLQTTPTLHLLFITLTHTRGR